MKKIVVLTDFSERAFNAAQYAVELATRLHAEVVLVNSFIVPSSEPMSAQIAWPMEDFHAIKAASEAGLKKLETQLNAQLKTASFRPEIKFQAQEGTYYIDIDGLLNFKDVIMLILANHQKGFSSLMLGNHTSKVLEHATIPVLIIPEKARFKSINKIAFATDLKPEELAVIQSVATLAKYFNAQILMAHLCKPASENARQVDDFLHEVTNKINYSNIYYRQLEEIKVDGGLNGMAATVQADMMVMVHHHKNFLNRLLGSSHTQKVAAETEIPLLVFPCPADHLPCF